MSTEPKFYAVDALDAYPEPVGTDDKLELNLEAGAVYVHLNYKRTKLVGLQSLDFLIRNLELIRAEALGPRQAAPVVECQPVGWITEDHLTDKSATTYDRATADRWISKGWPVSPIYADPIQSGAAKAFAKGFNTLETTGGKYKIVMQFAGRDDAWEAYSALSQMTASLDKVKELNQ